MKIFNGRAAAEDYMSTHTLTFSTPEMTLKKFALWLSEQISMPGDKDQVPRLMSFIREIDKEKSHESEFMPDIDESFKPSGAVVEMYAKNSNDSPRISSSGQPGPDYKQCIGCSHSLKVGTKFCPKCGTKQII